MQLAMRYETAMTEKTCPTCGESKPLSEFYIGNSKCKSCRKVAAKRYRERAKKNRTPEQLDKLRAHRRALHSAQRIKAQKGKK